MVPIQYQCWTHVVSPVAATSGKAQFALKIKG